MDSSQSQQASSSLAMESHRALPSLGSPTCDLFDRVKPQSAIRVTAKGKLCILSQQLDGNAQSGRSCLPPQRAKKWRCQVASESCAMPMIPPW